jgi:DtxR family Mn-dependent transcriptional regulator
MTNEPKPAPQDYLKAIHRLTEGAPPGGRAGTKALALQLRVSPPSVSAMLDRLAEDGLVDYIHYGGARLTRRGRAAAMRVIRRHRLLELYLTRMLGLGWDEVHDEAEHLEHVLSSRLEAAIDEALGHPRFDPHGDPIPSSRGDLEVSPTRSLWSVREGERTAVARVSDMDSDLLRHLKEVGIVPGAALSVLRREAGGVIRLEVEGRATGLGREAAERVFVRDG